MITQYEFFFTFQYFLKEGSASANNLYIFNILLVMFKQVHYKRQTFFGCLQTNCYKYLKGKEMIYETNEKALLHHAHFDADGHFRPAERRLCSY